ncbi:ankyrin repeat domain-containing protein [Marilutibacter chinensis]
MKECLQDPHAAVRIAIPQAGDLWYLPDIPANSDMKPGSILHGWIGQLLCGPLLCSLLASCWAGLPSTPEALARQRAEGVFDDPRAQALAVAAELNRTDEMRRLMRDEGVDPDLFFGKQNDRLPLVAWPILARSPEGLKAMLENGADPNARSPDQRVTKHDDGSGGTYFLGITALQVAAPLDDQTYLKLLLEHGADPDTPTRGTESMLYYAKVNGAPWSSIQMLIERGAKVTGYAGMGASIIGSYASFADFDKVYWLLEHGADPMDPADHGPSLPPPQSHVIDHIYWYPAKTADGRRWQRKSQLWLLEHGYPQPEKMSDHIRKTRADFGCPTDEKDIPLPRPGDTLNDTKEDFDVDPCQSPGASGLFGAAAGPG